MRIPVVFLYVGYAILMNAILLFASAGISWHYHDTAFIPLLLSAFVTCTVGVFPLIFVPHSNQISIDEGFLVVILSWLTTCLFGALPYVMWGGEFSFVNAVFESVSGFTTTGATILNDVEALPKGLLFWRSSTHWLGGIGVVVIALVILPSLGSAKLRLSKASVSSLAKMDDFKMTSKQIVRMILWVYIGLTALQTLLLYFAGMNFFDAVNHAFATIATGGFSTKNLSVMAYNSLPIEVIISVFMFLSSLNFALLYAAIVGRVASLFRSPVVRYFFYTILAGILAVTVDLKMAGLYAGWGESLRYASFQVITTASTSGFAAASNAAWPAFSVLLMYFFMIQCGCAGSTAGGAKADRLLIFFRTARTQIKQMRHPNATIPVKVNKVIVSDEVVTEANVFLVCYIALGFVGALLLTLTGKDVLTSTSAAYACLSNVGPGFGEVYSLGNYSGFTTFGKYVCSGLMLLGRVEIFLFAVLFTGIRSRRFK